MTTPKNCCPDIHTLHSELIHPAWDIQFAISYLNGILPANITDIDKYNVQEVLEKYFSLSGIPVIGEQPIGAKDSLNLIYRTNFEFIQGTLEVFLSGISLVSNQTDPNRDFNVHPDNKGFTILIDPSVSFRLNKPPKQRESLFVNYRKRITFNTIGGT